jgi:hypothetical protein
MNILTFFVFRFGVQLWSLHFVVYWRNHYHFFYFACGFFGGIMFLLINTLLFVRILASEGLLCKAVNQYLAINRFLKLKLGVSDKKFTETNKKPSKKASDWNHLFTILFYILIKAYLFLVFYNRGLCGQNSFNNRYAALCPLVNFERSFILVEMAHNIEKSVSDFIEKAQREKRRLALITVS